MSKQTLRLIGAFLAFVGSLVLAYAAYAYVSQKQLEAALTARIPGQSVESGGQPTAIVLMPVGENRPTPAFALPVLSSANFSPSVTPFPTHATPVQPDETSVIHVIGTATAISLTPRTPLPTESAGTNSIPAQSSPTPTGVAATLEPVTSKAIGIRRGTGAPAARLQIPKLAMDTAVKDANYVTFQQNGQLISDWNVPYDAAGHLSSTAQPGEIGNAVISGHHNLTAPGTFGLGLFAGLWNLTVGDEIRVGTADGKTQIWRVKESFPVKEAGEPLDVRIQHAQQIMGDTPEPTLTLLTCWNGKSNPLAGNTYRWIVHAELVNIN